MKNMIRLLTVLCVFAFFIPDKAFAKKKGSKGGGGGGGTTTTTTTSSTTTTTSSGGGGSTTTTTTSTTTTTGASGGGGSTPVSGISTNQFGASNKYSIVSVGTVNGQTRVVTMEGVQKKTWADYALWSADNRDIYFKAGEVFNGKVHSNTKLWFSGDPHFYAKVTSGDSTFGGTTNACTFENGFYTGYATGSMASVNFTNLKQVAKMVFTGATEITFMTTNMVVTNSRRGWNRVTNAIPTDSLIYIADDSSGANPYGDITIGGTIDERLTLVSDRTINITNHIYYASDPRTNSAADDALGLIARHDVIVQDTCPSNLNIFAHIMATGKDTSSTSDGSFGVENYDSISAKGDLTVVGGIVQAYRGAVGTFNSGTGITGSGFDKAYTYDTRFSYNPPPYYPPLEDCIEFSTWRDEYQ